MYVIDEEEVGEGRERAGKGDDGDRCRVLNKRRKFLHAGDFKIYSLAFCSGWVTTKVKELPSYRFDEKRPGLTVFWQRPVLRLKIDSSQLTSGDDLPDSIISHLPRNNTSKVSLEVISWF